MNFKQQLQEAYEAGYNSSLNEQQNPSNPYPPDSIDYVWWQRMMRVLLLMQTGSQGLELFRNDWDLDGEITFNDLTILLSFWSQGITPPSTNFNIEPWLRDNLRYLPMDSDHPLRLEANQIWQGGLNQLQDLIDSGVYGAAYLDAYDYNGDGVLTQEDHTLMTEIWQSGIWPLWAYEWSNQFAPPDLEVPDLPKPRLPKRILPRRGKSSPFRSTRKGR